MQISVELPGKLASRLEDVAKETARPRAFHFRKAVEAYLDDYADSQIALNRLRDARDPVISGKELRKHLGL